MKKLLLSSLICSALLVSNTSSVLADEISDLKGEIKSSKDKISNLETEKGAVSLSIDETEKAINKIKKEISDTTAKISSTENEIKQLSAKIVSKTKEIKKLEKELEAKKEIIAKNLKLMSQKTSISFVEYLFTAENLPDLLSRFDNLQDIAKAHEQIYDDTVVQNELVKSEKASLEKDKAKVESKKKDLVSLEASLKDKQKEQKKLLTAYESQFSELESEISSQEAAINVINNQISDIIAKREAERLKREAEAKKKAEELAKKKAEEAKRKADAEKKGESYTPSPGYSEVVESLSEGTTDLVGSGFSLPLKRGSYSISSEFGWRTHPIQNTQKLHAGIDLAAPVGTPIYASDSGTVIYSGAASGYGNWIVLDHNNGYYSIYAHMYDNQLYVNVGQQVKQGQNIAAVGSSGGSTGAHLHFEISKGGISSGNKLNPRNFISF